MTLSRRSFIGAIIAAATAPAIVRSGLIMPIKPTLVIPEVGDFTTRDIVVKSTQCFGTKYLLIGYDAYGKRVSETIDIASNQVGTIEFASVSSCQMLWSPP